MKSLFALLLALGAGPAVAGGDDDGPREPPEASVASLEPAGRTGTVHLTPKQEETSGLVVEPLRVVRYRPELLAYGKVLDIHPLLGLRVRYRAARAEAGIAAVALELARKNRDRLNALHREDIVAGRELSAAVAQWQTDRARAEAARRLPEEIRRETEHGFGPELTRLALDGETALFEDLAAHRRFLLRITLPEGYALPFRDTVLWVARNDDRSKAAEARLISPAPATDDLVQGETWFFQVQSRALRAGMRVNAWVPVGEEALAGVVLPLSAVVWHGGKPWVYRETGDGGYARTEVRGYRDYGGGWFVAEGFETGGRIAVTGAQMLLSEEFRRQIPEEDDD